MAPESPKVLVLLAALNGEPWIEEQIATILGQSGVAVHIAVRDDGSSDATFAIVSRLAASDSRVRLSTDGLPSGSAAQSFLSLIRANDATGFQYVALADQDDLWNQGKLRRAVDVIATTSSGYSSAVTAIWSTGSTRLLRQQPAMTESDFLFEGAGQGCTFVLPIPLYRRVRAFLIEEKALTANIHYHDWTIYALARAWNGSWTFDQSSTMRYRQHEFNDTGARASLRGITARLRKIRAGWYRRQLLAISDICRSAEPSNSVITTWHALLRMPASWKRRTMIVRFCMAGGRRRRLDNLILIGAALIGWI